MSSEKVVCSNCGKLTVRKKRCMFCWAALPQEEQAEMGGTGMPYWHRKEE